ncbi:MAG: acyl-CoA desaturase [Crocinitomicaceae bacterium]|nr:acyl-CoA desaturase [Crocinitomicaceae bacterium]
MEREIKYKKDEPGGFTHTLNERVNEYFKTAGITRKTNNYGRFKVILFLLIFSSLVAAIYTANGNVALLLGAFTVLGFIQICCALILGHEGVHGAFSNSKFWNKALTYMFDMVGTSGHLWSLRHVHSHHPYPMIPDVDTDIHQTGMLTFPPMENPPKFFKYQHIYSPFLYLFYTFSVVVKRDFVDFFSSKIGHKVIKHKRKEFIELFVTKAIYFTYTLVLPLLLSGVYWGWVLLGFMLMHIAESLTAAMALFPAHLHENSVFPLPDENGNMQTTWAEHQLRVTMDFGTRWHIVGFFFGGINYHAVHHMFPAMAHVHFHKVQKILVQTCKDFGIQHNVEPYMYKSLISHVKLLKRNGVSRKNLHHLSEVI